MRQARTPFVRPGPPAFRVATSVSIFLLFRHSHGGMGSRSAHSPRFAFSLAACLCVSARRQAVLPGTRRVPGRRGCLGRLRAGG